VRARRPPRAAVPPSSRRARRAPRRGRRRRRVVVVVVVVDGDVVGDARLSPEDLVRAQYKDNAAESMGDSILGGQSIVTGTTEEMKDLVPFGANNLAVLRATKQYAEAFEAGLDPGQVVAQTLGVDSLANLSPAQRCTRRRCARSWRRTRSACAGTPWRRSGCTRRASTRTRRACTPTR
jgi:hypothetical protein